jgi:N6-adenosine-specific RNA methylase IME4
LKRLPVEQIRIDGGTQPRAEINQLVVDDYAEAMKSGAEFPPVVVFFDGAEYWLADGFHRWRATRQAESKDIAARVEKGTQRDAILFSVGANASHGLRRTNADKRRAVGVLLADKEWVKRSDRWIAEKCGVSQPFVGGIRSQLTTVISSRLGQDGKERKLPVLSRLSGAERAQLEAIASGEAVVPEESAGVLVPVVRRAIGDLPFADDPAQVRELAAQPAPLQASIAERVASGEAETVREAKSIINAEQRADMKAQPAPKIPPGKFRCIVIDPPWAMEKIERDERPNQLGFDYPTMTEAELAAFPLVPEKAADDCHLYLWTTHKHLPSALRLSEAWGFRYQCMMTWVKNVGFTPFSWMYSTEHVLFCRKGSMQLEKLGMRLDFSAKVREHSRKPDNFYDLVRLASPGPRLDAFSREHREGFAQYGNEIAKFAEAMA